MGAHRRALVTRLLSQTEPKGSLLDVGAQAGHGIAIARESGFDPVAGVEPVSRFVSEHPGVIVQGHAADLPFPDRLFDYVTCWDVIEHILPFDIEPALREFARVSRRGVLMTAAIGPSYVQESGRDLHPSARPAVEWDALFRDVYEGWHVRAELEVDCSPAWIITRL